MKATRSAVGFCVALAVVGGIAIAHAGQLDVTHELERAKALYRDARFTEAVAKLHEVIVSLTPVAGEKPQKEQLINAYLYAALCHIALDSPHAAKESFKSLLKLDRNRQLDPGVYAPKVVELFAEARGNLPEEPADESAGVQEITASPPTAEEKKGGSKALPILLGVGAAGGAVALASGGGGDAGSGVTTIEIDITGRWSIEHRSTGFCSGTIDFHSSGTFLIDYSCPEGWEVSGPWSLDRQTLEYTQTLWVRKLDGEPFAESTSYRGTVTASSGTFVINKIATSHTETISR